MSWDMLPDMLWKSALLLGVTLLLLRLLQNRSAAQRAFIAHAGLTATLLLPLASLLLPRWEVDAAPVAGLAAPVTAIFTAPQPAPVLDDVIVSSMVSLPAPATDALLALMPDTAMLVVLAWGLPALALLLVMLLAVARLFLLRSRAAVMQEQSWLAALAQAQARMNFKHGTALLVSSEIASPVSWGVLRPVILLNGKAAASGNEAEAIIAHELAHVSRLDWAGLLLGRIVTALHWFNPLAWMLARQAHQLREEAADDAVLRSNVDRMDYAALLVGAARHEARGFLLAANGVAPSRGSLKRRITRVLDEHQLRAPAYLGWTLACLLGAVALALPLAAFSATQPREQIAQAMTPAPTPARTPDASYDPQVDAYVFGSPATPKPPKPPARERAPLTAQEAAEVREQARELAREVRQREQEKAREIAERARERAQALAERERERNQEAAVQRERLFELARNAMESAKRELAERERLVERAGEREEVRRDLRDAQKDVRAMAKELNAVGERVTISVPGVFIQADPQGATIRAPGVNIQANPQGATVRVPGVNIQARADTAMITNRAGANAGNNAGANAGNNAGSQSGASAGKPTSNELIQMAMLAIDQRYRDDIANAGYSMNVDQLHQIRMHGMTGDWLRGLARAGYDRLSVTQIRNIAIHRVTPDFAQRMVQQASSRPTPEELVRLRIAYGGRMPGEPDKAKSQDKSK